MDLTKIDRPFGLLDKETQDSLMAWPHGTQRFEGIWVDMPLQTIGWRRGFMDSFTYRARPAPLVPDSICWEHVAPEWKFMARDENGQAWLFTTKPWILEDIWMDSDDCFEAKLFASYRRGTVDWKDSLVERPE